MKTTKTVRRPSIEAIVSARWKHIPVPFTTNLRSYPVEVQGIQRGTKIVTITGILDYRGYGNYAVRNPVRIITRRRSRHGTLEIQ